MASLGKVVGGHYIDGTVSTNLKGDLVIQAGFKRRKLVAEEIIGWYEVVSDTGMGTATAVGKAVGAALPGFIGRAVTGAIDAASPRTVHIEWADGKQSLLKLPEQLFTHLTIMLKDRRVSPPVVPTPKSRLQSIRDSLRGDREAPNTPGA